MQLFGRSSAPAAATFACLLPFCSVVSCSLTTTMASSSFTSNHLQPQRLLQARSILPRAAMVLALSGAAAWVGWPICRRQTRQTDHLTFPDLLRFSSISGASSSKQVDLGGDGASAQLVGVGLGGRRRNGVRVSTRAILRDSDVPLTVSSDL